MLLYAQDEGIAVVWRGGRTLKPAKPNNAPSNPNGTSNNSDSIMIIDSDDDEPPESAKIESIEYEGELDNHNSEQPDRIIARTFIAIGETPLHISTPPLCRSPSAHRVQFSPKYCADNIVVAAACADGSVRLLAFPLVPSDHERQEPLEDVRLHSDEHSSKPPGGVSLSYTTRDYTSYDFDSFSEDNPTISRHEEWDLLVSWHVAEPFPAVSVAQVPIETIKGENRIGKPRRRTYHLPSPLISLSFNPAVRQLNRQKQLLMADSQGLVRICELVFTAKTSVSGAVQFELARTPNWAATFYIPFEASHNRSAGANSPAGRKRILGAEWAVDGRCIIAMLGDGTWGLWDLERVQPQLSGTRQSSSITGGVSGGGVTHFSLRGGLASKAAATVSVPKRTKASQELSIGEKRLAPMTPNTRKVTQNTFLDKGPSRGVEASKASRGGLSVSRLSEPVVSAPYETVIMWYDDSFYMIPNIMLYWQRAIQSASKDSAAPSSNATIVGPSPIHLSELSTLGEAVSSVSQCAAYNDQELASHQRLQHDFVIAAEHRLVFFCPTKSQSSVASTAAENSDTAAHSIGPGIGSDEQLLARGELGLAGLDRLMDDMDSGTTNGGLFGHAERSRRVGFATGP